LARWIAVAGAQAAAIDGEMETVFAFGPNDLGVELLTKGVEDLILGEGRVGQT
jgi:hypothetical protein